MAPRPKPAAIRALHHSRTRPRHRVEPTIPDTVDPTTIPPTIGAPRGLSKVEREYWTRFAALLSGARILTPADVETLADYCRACAAVDDRARRSRRELRKRAFDPQLARLWDLQLRQWIDRKTKLAGELGLTAIARTRVPWTGHRLPGDTPAAAAPARESKFAQLQQQAAVLRRPIEMPPRGGRRR